MTEPNVDLQFSYGDETWQKLRKRADEDAFFFNHTILGLADRFKLLPETHLVAHVVADRKTGIPDIDNAPMQLQLWPRETGKSSCITTGMTVRRACMNPNSSTLIVNEKAQTAEDFISTIKGYFENNALLRALYPEVVPPDFNKTTWQAGRATLQREHKRPEPTFDSTGVGGTKIGKHFDHIICDDLISEDAMEAARSGNWEVMDKVCRWTTRLPPLLSASAKPFPTITFIGTIWWHDDVYDYIRKTFTYGEEPRRYRVNVSYQGKTYSRDVWRAGDLVVFKMSAVEKGRVVFPEIWPADRLEKVRMTNPMFYYCNLLNQPVNDALKTFDNSWLKYWRTSDGFDVIYEKDDGSKQYTRSDKLYKIICVDPAFTVSKDSARSAIVVLALDQETGKYIVLDAIADKLDTEDLAQRILDTADRWGTTRVYIEVVGQQKALVSYVERAALDRNQPLAIEPLKPSGRNKDLRIETLVPYFKNGDIYVSPTHRDLLDEYTNYHPTVKHKDMLDVLAYAVEVAPKPSQRATSSGNARDRASTQLSKYYSRRGLRKS